MKKIPNYISNIKTSDIYLKNTLKNIINLCHIPTNLLSQEVSKYKYKYINIAHLLFNNPTL